MTLQIIIKYMYRKTSFNGVICSDIALFTCLATPENLVCLSTRMPMNDNIIIVIYRMNYYSLYMCNLSVCNFGCHYFVHNYGGNYYSI